VIPVIANSGISILRNRLIDAAEGFTPERLLDKHVNSSITFQ
jgi:hypothetical protein